MESTELPEVLKSKKILQLCSISNYNSAVGLCAASLFQPNTTKEDKEKELQLKWKECAGFGSIDKFYSSTCTRFVSEDVPH
jgi:hypothetical protein